MTTNHPTTTEQPTTITAQVLSPEGTFTLCVTNPPTGSCYATLRFDTGNPSTSWSWAGPGDVLDATLSASLLEHASRG